MTQPPQHPSEMGLKPRDVIRYEGPGDYYGFTVGKNYPVMEGRFLVDDHGIKHFRADINPYRRFTLVSRADDINAPHGDFPSENYLSPDDDDRWFPVSTLPDWEYQINANGLPEGRPRKPKVRRVAAELNYNIPGLPHFIEPSHSITGFVTVTDGVPDWTTFSENEDL